MATADVLERLGHLLVGTGASGRTEALVDRVANEGVGEGVVTRGTGDFADKRGSCGGFQDLENFVLGKPRGPGEKIEVEPSADHRRYRQGALGAIPESGDAPADDFSDAVREGQRAE
jgi:hypothetical protein